MVSWPQKRKSTPKRSWFPLPSWLLVVLAATATAGIYGYYRYQAMDLSARAIADQWSRAENIQEHLSQYLQDAVQLDETAAALVPQHQGQSPPVETLITGLLKSSPQNIYGVGVWYEPYHFSPHQQYYGLYAHRTDHGGMAITHRWAAKSYGFTDQNWYREAKQGRGRVVFVGPYLDHDWTYITAARVFYNHSGQVQGVVSVDLIRPDLARVLSQLQEPSYERVYLTTAQGKLLAYPQAQALLQYLHQRGVKTNHLTSVSVRHLQSFQRTTGLPATFTVTTSVPLTGWVVHLEADRAQLFQNIYGLRSSLAVFVVVMWLAVFLRILVAHHLQTSASEAQNRMSAIEESQAALRIGQQRLQSKNEVLLELTKLLDPAQKDLKTLLESISQQAASALGVDRLGVWRFNEDRTVLECLNLCKQGHHSHGLVLLVEAYPAYFQALEEFRIIDAAHPWTDPRTACLAGAYLQPLGITAFLGAPVHLRGQTAGIVCYEQVGTEREWTDEEQQFAASIADLIALGIEAVERNQVEAQLVQYAFYDSLTGLPNHIFFLDHLNQYLRQQHPEQPQLFSLLYIGLDRFESVRHSFGHLIAQQLLVEVVTRLKSCFQGDYLLARINTDEFALLLEGVKVLEEADQTAKQIHQVLSEPFNLGSYEVFTTISIGLVHSDVNYSQADEFLQAADMAMHRVKALRTGSYLVFDSTMRAQALERFELHTSLRRALERGELQVHYQPMVSLEDRQVLGAEALVRWPHGQQGYLSPSIFIPIAEETGLIALLGEWVLRQACQQLLVWHQVHPQPLLISVNVSALQLGQADFLGQIDRILAQTGVDPAYLKLEVTEGTVMENPDWAVEKLKQIKSRGIQLSIDDFGTGYSSLSYLRAFPFDMLKIDRSFVCCLDQEPESREIVRTIVSLAHNLGMQVVAEGIETLSQANYLQSIGCGLGQGYFFSPPLDWAAMGTFLTRQGFAQPVLQSISRPLGG